MAGKYPTSNSCINIVSIKTIYHLISGVLISGFAISIRPLIEYLIVGKFKEYRGDGINRTTTVAVWVPFIDPSILWQNVLVFFLQYVIIWTTPGKKTFV